MGKRVLNVCVLGTTDTVPVEFTTWEYSNDRYLIPRPEIERVAREFNVPSPEFVSEGAELDNAFWPDQAPNNMIRVLRYRALYRITMNGQTVYGTGSAGADNVGRWDIKAYSYDMAHKRARVRCYKEALGLPDELVDIEISDENKFVKPTTQAPMEKVTATQYAEKPPEPLQIDDGELSEFTESVKPEQTVKEQVARSAVPAFLTDKGSEDTLANNPQCRAVFNIILRLGGEQGAKYTTAHTLYRVLHHVIEEPDLWKLVQEKMGLPEIEAIADADNPVTITSDSFACLTEAQAKHVIMKYGNFSNSAITKPTQSISVAENPLQPQ